jgi:hypothetical protein
MNQSIEDASRNSIIEDAKAAGFYIDYSDHEGTSIWDSNPSDVEQDGCGMVELNKMLTKFAQLREARQSSQSEPVAKYWDMEKYSYSILFNAIAAAVNIQGSGIGISVKAFEEEMIKQVGSIAAPQQAIPSGWKLVPIEPTEEMLEQIPLRGTGSSAESIYDAILSASPTAPIERDK